MFVQASQFVVVHLAFEKADRYFYLLIFISTVLFAALCMLIAILVRNLLETIYENKRLFETIKNILNALPEGVVIECNEGDKDTVVIKYANSVAKTRLFKEDPDDQPINQLNLSSKIVGGNFEGIADNFQINVPEIKIQNLFDLHRQKIIEGLHEFSSMIE